MSDAAEYWHRQYEALKREHVALIEQTAALRTALKEMLPRLTFARGEDFVNLERLLDEAAP